MSNVGDQFIFNYTGSIQHWSVPSDVINIKIECYGSGGGNSNYGSNYGNGGVGGYSIGNLAVTGGQTLNIYVGGSNGWNGGGAGYQGASNCGGGATDIRIGGTALSNRIIVAGGGGGAGVGPGPGHLVINGGAGGGLTGGNGTYYSSYSGNPGYGGTQTTGGNGGINGTLGQGGNGGTIFYAYFTGAGGGGYYGGGGASSRTGSGSYDNTAASGGGGSGYVGGVSNSYTITGGGSPAGVNGKCVITILMVIPPVTINNLIKTIINNQIILSANNITTYNNILTVKYRVSIKQSDNNIIIKQDYNEIFQNSPLLFNTLIFNSNEFKQGTNQIIIDMINSNNASAQAIINITCTNTIKLLIQDGSDWKYINNNTLNVLPDIITDNDKELAFLNNGMNNLNLINNGIMQQIENNNFKILMGKINILS